MKYLLDPEPATWVYVQCRDCSFPFLIPVHYHSIFDISSCWICEPPEPGTKIKIMRCPVCKPQKMLPARTSPAGGIRVCAPHICFDGNLTELCGGQFDKEGIWSCNTCGHKVGPLWRRVYETNAVI